MTRRKTRRPNKTDLEHWNTVTRHVRMSPAAELRPGVLDSLVIPVAQLLAGTDKVPIPGTPGYYLENHTPESEDEGTTLILRHESGIRILNMTIGLGQDDAGAWQRAWTGHGKAPDCPDSPWCADRVHKDVTTLPLEKMYETMSWTGDLSRCLAWAVINAREGRVD